MERHFTLSCNEIHLWQADLSSTEPSILPLLRALSADEYARAERYALPHLRRRFVVARGILRSLVGSYLGIVPSEVRFCYGAFGKPMLDEARHKEALAFNLSHTEDFALFAFSLVHDIGVDVERIQKSFEVLSLAQQHFSINEYAALSALPTELQLSAFYACWTRKEAYLKARGAGLQTTSRSSMLPSLRKSRHNCCGLRGGRRGAGMEVTGHTCTPGVPCDGCSG